MATKSLPSTPEELKNEAARFFDSIKAESDRGCVLVAAAFLDEALEMLLRSRMSKDAEVIKASVKPLFTGIGPLKSFWAKTELSQVLGLLADYEYSDLNHIRSLRNHFAHSYVAASFDDQTAVDIVSKLRHFGLVEFPAAPEDTVDAEYVRRRFSLAAAWLAGTLHDRAGVTSGSAGAQL